MRRLDLSNIAETGLVLHFGTTRHAISATTFASALVEFENAARSAIRLVEPDYEFDVYLEAIGPGTFRAKLVEKSVAKLLGLRKPAGAVALSLLAAFLYDRYLDGENVTLTDDFAVIERGEDRVVLPRTVYEQYNETASAEELEEPVRKFVAAIQADDDIAYFALSEDIEVAPPIPIPRNDFSRITRPPTRVLEQEEDTRKREAKREVVGVLKAVFERGNRKWQFIWQGQKISAPIIDDAFFDRLESREISFAQGDALVVDLLIAEQRMPGLAIWRQIDHKLQKFTMLSKLQLHVG